MTKLTEDNIAIADMLGWVYLEQLDRTRTVKAGYWTVSNPAELCEKSKLDAYIGRSKNDLKFHENWNHLMVAVEFIETLPNSYMSCYWLFDSGIFIAFVSGIFGTIVNENFSGKTTKMMVKNKSKILATFEAVAEFAKFYNKQKLVKNE